MRKIRTIQDVLSYAIEREIEANSFYKKLAKSIRKPKVRTAIENFALDEYQHKLRLEAVREGQITLTEEDVGSIDLSGLSHNVKPEPRMTYKELLAYAIGKEDQANQFYSKLAKLCKRQDLKEMFSLLAQEEAQHKFSLEIEYDLVTF